jgi:hypothetical protein
MAAATAVRQMAAMEAEVAARLHLRRELEAHLYDLGYTFTRSMNRVGTPTAEIARMSPVRGRLVYGETVLRADLKRRRCHDRLRFFAQRRTRRRSQILFFVAVEEACRSELEALLIELGIRGAVRGGNVHVLPVSVPAPAQPRRPTRRRSAP